MSTRKLKRLQAEFETFEDNLKDHLVNETYEFFHAVGAKNADALAYLTKIEVSMETPNRNEIRMVKGS